ncbi:MAG: hypothetical protein LBN03_00355 [Bifidobacteriaceae bacterium]|jgi:hypothetical protein|nr:hypothetical protein [Bifidobacteriaceae bacterium]
MKINTEIKNTEYSFSSLLEERGAITVFLTMCLLPIVAVMSFFLDSSRILLARAMVTSLQNNELQTILAAQDNWLHYEYGLFALTQEMDTATPLLSAGDGTKIGQQYTTEMNNNIKTSIEGYADFLQIRPTTSSADNYAREIGNGNLANQAILEQQVLDTGKYVAVIQIMQNIKSILDSSTAREEMMGMKQILQDTKDLYTYQSIAQKHAVAIYYKMLQVAKRSQDVDCLLEPAGYLADIASEEFTVNGNAEFFHIDNIPDVEQGEDPLLDLDFTLGFNSKCYTTNWQNTVLDLLNKPTAADGIASNPTLLAMANTEIKGWVQWHFLKTALEICGGGDTCKTNYTDQNITKSMLDTLDQTALNDDEFKTYISNNLGTIADNASAFGPPGLNKLYLAASKIGPLTANTRANNTQLKFWVDSLVEEMQDYRESYNEYRRWCETQGYITTTGEPLVNGPITNLLGGNPFGEVYKYFKKSYNKLFLDTPVTKVNQDGESITQTYNLFQDYKNFQTELGTSQAHFISVYNNNLAAQQSNTSNNGSAIAGIFGHSIDEYRQNSSLLNPNAWFANLNDSYAANQYVYQTDRTLYYPRNSLLCMAWDVGMYGNNRQNLNPNQSSPTTECKNNSTYLPYKTDSDGTNKVNQPVSSVTVIYKNDENNKFSLKRNLFAGPNGLRVADYNSSSQALAQEAAKYAFASSTAAGTTILSADEEQMKANILPIAKMVGNFGVYEWLRWPEWNFNFDLDFDFTISLPELSIDFPDINIEWPHFEIEWAFPPIITITLPDFMAWALNMLLEWDTMTLGRDFEGRYHYLQSNPVDSISGVGYASEIKISLDDLVLPSKAGLTGAEELAADDGWLSGLDGSSNMWLQMFSTMMGMTSIIGDIMDGNLWSQANNVIEAGYISTEFPNLSYNPSRIDLNDLRYAGMVGIDIPTDIEDKNGYKPSGTWHRKLNYQPATMATSCLPRTEPSALRNQTPEQLQALYNGGSYNVYCSTDWEYILYGSEGNYSPPAAFLTTLMIRMAMAYGASYGNKLINLIANAALSIPVPGVNFLISQLLRIILCFWDASTDMKKLVVKGNRIPLYKTGTKGWNFPFNLDVPTPGGGGGGSWTDKIKSGATAAVSKAKEMTKKQIDRLTSGQDDNGCTEQCTNYNDWMSILTLMRGADEQNRANMMLRMADVVQANYYYSKVDPDTLTMAPVDKWWAQKYRLKNATAGVQVAGKYNIKPLFFSIGSLSGTQNMTFGSTFRVTNTMVY